VKIVNFGHPLTDGQIADTATLARQAVETVLEVPTHIEEARPLGEQAMALVAAVGLDARAWQTEPLLVNPPGYVPLALALVAVLHGLMGHFPPVLRLRPVDGSLPPVYEIAEIVNLQALRQRAREIRARNA
jgi:hypothetical protein